MKKFFNKAVSLALVGTMAVSLTACGSQTSDKNDQTTAAAVSDGSTTAANETTQAGDSEATYTLNQYMEASPVNWNPHSWEMNADDEILGYLTMGLVDMSIAEDGETYQWVYEMADSITDITATFADKDKYNITEDAGRVWQIDLNQAATWQDGTPINADTYIYSMQQLLNPEMKNYRANSYTDGDVALYNGAAYFNNDLAGQTMYGAAVTDDGVTEADEYFLNVDEACVFFGEDTIADYIAAGYEANFPSLAELSQYVGQGYVAVTDEMVEVLKALAVECGDENPDAWYEMTVVPVGTYEAIDFSEVGIVKTGDYQILYITENPIEEFYFLAGMTGSWLVKEDLYEANKVTTEGLVSTSYGTAMDNTCSFGPYKLVSFETDKQFILERNENWYGYTDGKHEGQYQTDKVVYDIVADHNTALQLFQSGKLDSVGLVADDLVTYRMSDYLMKTDQTYTYRWIFATDIDALAALEVEANDGSNKKVLSYDDFRKAISLSMDRAKFTTEATPAYKPAYFLLNYLYYTDIANDPESQYRKTDEAKQAILNLYGIEYGDGKTYATIDDAFNSITGYDVEAAKELFQSVYTQAIADGNYTDGQKINITCEASAASALTADDTAQCDLLNDFVAAATVGTGFEGMITFNFVAGATDRYGDVAAGKIEMIRGAWGGAAFYPFSTIRVYCEPDYMGGLDKIHESCGWDPTVETLDVTYDFDGDGKAETVTDTFQNWAKSMNGAGAYASDPEACLTILSSLETGILSAYQCIPWGTITDVTLHSQKIEYATYDYNIMYAYGGIRLMTYNYSDAEWEEYVASQGGTLNYE